MNQIDKERIIKRYNERIQRCGSNIQGLASGTEERRNIRFDIMTEIGINNGDEVLDLGCGFGDYSKYLEKKQINVNYTGYDINSLIIEEAKKRYSRRTFEVKDILNQEIPDFDYIVSTTSFNLPLTGEDNYEFITRLLNKCYKHARKGVSIDFLTSYVDYPSLEGFHYQPERIFTIAKQITKRVRLRHDYPLFEFSIYLYKDFKGWGIN